MKLTIFLLICNFVHIHVCKADFAGCPSKGNAHLPHPQCSHFIICSNGIRVDMKCPATLYYNPATIQCDYPENVEGCSGGMRIPIAPTEAPTTTTSAPSVTLTECGQTAVADDGIIQYKLNQPYDANELCVFIIRFKTGWGNYTFTLDDHGISDQDPNALGIFPIGLTKKAYPFGPSQRSLTFASFEAMIIFKTKSRAGTGFKIRFNREPMNQVYKPLPGNDFIFNSEAASPLQIPNPSNYTSASYSHNYVFTSGSKLITDPDSYLKLTIVANFNNPSVFCGNGFEVFVIENNEVITSKHVCKNQFSGKVFEFTSRGLIFVSQFRIVNHPVMTGVISWETVSKPAVC